MIPIYRFKLGFDDSTPFLVHPVYKSDLAIKSEKETGQRFFRRKMSGKLVFIGEEFAAIMAEGFGTVYHVFMEISDNGGLTWTAYWHGKFMRTDCTINLDEKTVTVQPNVIDEYTDIMNAWDKEYNLIELAPAIDRVGIWKRAALQVYLLGDSKLTFIVNGLSFEQDVDDDKDLGELVTNMHFGQNGRNRELHMTLNGVDYNMYEGILPFNDDVVYNVRYNCEDGQTYVYNTRDLDVGSSQGMRRYQIRRTSDDMVLWEYLDTTAPYDDEMEFDLEPKNGSVGTMHCKVYERTVLTRILLDVETYNGFDTYPLTSNDFCYDNRNYRRCFPANISGADVFVVNNEYSPTPTEWGRNNDGLYFVKPTSLDPMEFYPIGRSQWIYTSMWFRDAGFMTGIEAYGNKKAEISTNYTLASVLKALLAKIDPNVTFDETSAYSQFLYGTTDFNFAANKLVMTPKSNLLAGEFSQPAMKAPITIRDVMTMLRDVLQCYWYVDSDNRLRIEHVSFFKNGGSYSTQPTVGIDLTAMENTRNGKKWSFCTSEYSFNKEDMPSRYQFEWMDDVTEAFIGKPIDIVSKYVQEEKVEEVSISNFTSDVDFMLLAPENISKDGFALFACVLSSGVYNLTIGAIGTTPAMSQNYILALTNLLPKYWTYDLPASAAAIDGQSITVHGMRRNKRQEVNVPLGATDPDTMQLIKTDLGNGQIEDININLSSRMAKITLAYDTES